MKFVITGGTGFIGSHLAKYLLSKGHQVTVIDNLLRGKLENLSSFENEINFQKIDILNFESLREAFHDAEGIFHQAALTSVPESYTHKEKYHNVNVDGTENVFKIGKEYGIKIIYASSSSVYGNPTSTPINEESERNPINPYGMTKLEDENLAERYWKLGSEIIGLRYFNVYGIGQTSDYAGVITKFNEAIKTGNSLTVFGDGSQVRDFVSVEDVAEANLLAMQSNTKTGFVNVGTGIPTSIYELANLTIKLSKKSLESVFDNLPEGDVKESVAYTTLAKKLIDWNYKTSLKDGLQKFFFN